MFGDLYCAVSHGVFLPLPIHWISTNPLSCLGQQLHHGCSITQAAFEVSCRRNHKGASSPRICFPAKFGTAAKSLKNMFSVGGRVGGRVLHAPDVLQQENRD